MAKKKELDEQTAEELAETIAESQEARAPEGETPPEEPSGPREPAEDTETFEYTAADGTVYKAESSEALFKKVTDALNNTKLAVKDREFQIHDLKQQAPKKEEAPKAAYDHKAYLELLDKDGREAAKYLRSFDEDYQVIRQMREQTESGKKIQEEVFKFYRDVPDYPKIETKQLNDLMRERMVEKGRDWTAEGMTATYYELHREGKIPEVSEGTPASAAPKPPPASAAGKKGARTDTEPDVDNMTLAELKSHLRKAGVSGSEYLQ